MLERVGAGLKKGPVLEEGQGLGRAEENNKGLYGPFFQGFMVVACKFSPMGNNLQIVACALMCLDQQCSVFLNKI